jgi:GNAT superfamily N-acetyltransferase
MSTQFHTDWRDENMAISYPSTGTPKPVPKSERPAADSEDIVLVPANDLEYVQTWHLNAGEWRGPLSIEQYLRRERTLQNLDLTKNGHITAWILTSNKLPRNADGTRPILCSCETLMKHAYVAKNGKVQKILTHGIGSVYCRPEYRGTGYAGRMMVELGKAVETWQQPNGTKGTFSVLYSDIGVKFYSQRGWKAFPSTHIHLMPVDESSYNLIKGFQSLPCVEDLTTGDMPNIPLIHQLEQELIDLSKTSPDVPHVAIRPDMPHLQWHFAREEIQARELGVPGGLPLVKGAIHRATGTSLIWCRVYANKEAENQLHILRTVIDPSKSADEPEIQSALAALLLRAQLEAQKWNMQNGVELWSPSPTVVKAAESLHEGKKIEIISRDKEHVCSLKWIGGPADEEVVWVANEKYAWC